MIGVYVPEDDREEYWELRGRANALHDYLKTIYTNDYDRVDISAVAAILGFVDMKAMEEDGQPIQND